MGWLKLLARKGRTALRLSPTEQFLLLQAFALLPLVSLSLRWQGMKRTQQRLASLSENAKTLPNFNQACQIRQTARMVSVASRYSPAWTNCLRHSLVLWYLLRRQGIASELRIGVRREAGEFQAHAWVELGGLTLNDGQDVRRRYAAFDFRF
jgi:hypothetical protein